MFDHTLQSLRRGKNPQFWHQIIYRLQLLMLLSAEAGGNEEPGDASYLRSIEVQADVGEAHEQPQPLNYGGHQP